VEEFYNSAAWKEFSRRNGGHPGGLGATRELIEAASLVPGARILDLCCGGGESVALLAELGYEAFGLAGAEELSGIAPQSFDAVMCECSISLLDSGAALLELDRILKPRGALLLSDVYDGTPPVFLGFSEIYFKDKRRELIDYAAQWLWETGESFPLCADVKTVSYYHWVGLKGDTYGGL
jgi:ubiquinone/menaquinone biosynthesis C-methylase UbiE